MRLSKNKEIQIPELITILTISVGLWIFMYEKIIEISSKDIFSNVIFSLAFSHALIFFNVVFTLVLLYNKTRDKLNSRMFVISKKINLYLTNLWLPITFYCLINYLIFHLNTFTKFEYTLAINSIVSLIITALCFMYFYQISLKSLINKNGKDILIWGLLAFFSYYIYLPIMVIISSDIEINYSKEIFKDEDLEFRLTKRGYIFLPYIKTLKIGSKKELNIYDVNYSIDKSLIKNQNEYLEIIYEPQVFKITNKKIYYLPYIKQ